MNFNYLCSLLLSFLFLQPALALVSSISTTTKVLHPGQKFKVTVHTSNYIQNNAQYYILFGIAPGKGYNEALGSQLLGTGVDLVETGHSLVGSGSYDLTAQLPSSITTPSGGVDNYTLTAATFSTVGASGDTWTQFFTTTIRVSPN